MIGLGDCLGCALGVCCDNLRNLLLLTWSGKWAFVEEMCCVFFFRISNGDVTFLIFLMHQKSCTSFGEYPINRHFYINFRRLTYNRLKCL